VIHTYATPGSYSAKVTISNCVNTTGSTSRSATVGVSQGSLTASFAANDVTCQFSQCSASVGQSVAFLDSSVGATYWDYDWNHATSGPTGCNFTDNDHTTPVAAHAFTTAGTYYPCLRVRGASGASAGTVHVKAIVVGNTTQTPAVVVSGATTGTVNVSQTISAAASNCTPASNGWTWSTNGGTIGGSATGSSISVAWSTTGNKTVTASNSACGSASGSLVVNVGAAGPTPPTAQFVYTPSTPKVGDVVTFNAASSTNVVAGSTYAWDFGFGLVNGGSTILHSFSSDGNYSVQLVITPPGCSSASCKGSITHTVYVGQANAPVFTMSPPNPRATEDVIFDGRLSPNVVPGSLYGWSFGDGSPSAFGEAVAHTFGTPGTYTVQLIISPPGCTGNCYALSSVSIVVGPAPPVSARFTASVACGYTLGVDTCQAKTAKGVTLTAVDPNATSYSWSFGDGSSGSGRQLSHTWQAPGTYTVTLATTLGTASSVSTKSFVVTGAPPPKYKKIVLPSAFTTSTSPVQTSDLYLYNPSSSSLEVTFEFRRRGTVEDNPPRFATVLPPGAVYYTPDMLRNGFHLSDVSGFLIVTAKSETIEPLATAFNTRSATLGKLFGLAFSAASVPSSSSSASTSSPAQHLVGLADDADRQATFGLSNPSEQIATYKLRFFDKDGHFLRETSDASLGAYSQKVFGLEEIRGTLGIANLTDYRVEVESSAGPRPFPFANDVRTASGDPSLIQPTTTASSRVYLLGVGNGPGVKKSVLQTDLVVANVGGVAAQSTVALTKVTTGKAATTANPSTVAVPAGATLRLPDVLAKQLGSKSGFGVLTVTSTGAAGDYPAVFAETYDNTNPKLRFGQRIVPLTDADAAATGQKIVLLGLRQDYQNRTTVWLFNPGGTPATCTVVYRSLTGVIVGSKSVTLAAGQARQLGPTDHPIAKTGVPNGLVVEVQVTAGKVLAAGQVSSTPTNDLAFVRGTVR
jgi:PKD repeat protein